MSASAGRRCRIISTTSRSAVPFSGFLLYEKLGVPTPAVVIICMAAGLTVPYLLIRLLGGTRIGAAAERIGLPMGASRRISETESANGSI